MDTLPRADRAPEPPRRTLPRGVWWAIALAIVVLAVAGLKATSTPASSSGPPDQLDSSITQPAAVNPLIGSATTPSGLVGHPMPDATLERFAGGPASISGYRGTPMVINLWASSCVPCVTEMPAFEQVHREYGDRVAFVGVDSGEGIDPGRAGAATTGVTYDLLSDPQSLVAGSIKAVYLPATILVKSDGTIARVRFNGAVDPADLRRWIDQDLLS
jgi:thiol-disulfide isomerase/thioredoxin